MLLRLFNCDAQIETLFWHCLVIHLITRKPVGSLKFGHVLHSFFVTVRPFDFFEGFFALFIDYLPGGHGADEVQVSLYLGHQVLFRFRLTDNNLRHAHFVEGLEEHVGMLISVRELPYKRLCLRVLAERDVRLLTMTAE